MALTKENDSDVAATVLDMEVKIVQKNYITEVYCKTDNFPFNVISLPFLESNISNRLCYLVFYGQVLRYQRLCSLRKDFELRTLKLATQLTDRGYDPNKLSKQFVKVIGNYREEFTRFKLPQDLRKWFHEIMFKDENETDIKMME